MADVIRGLSIGLGLDTTGIDQGMKSLNSKLKAVNSEMKANMSAFDRGEKSVEKYQTQLTGMNKKLELQGRAVEAARREYEKMVQQHGEGSRQAERASTVYNNHVSDFNNLQRVVRDTTREFQEFQREQEVSASAFGRLADSMERGGERISKVGDNMKEVGTNFTKYVTAPIAALGIGTGIAAADVESSAVKIQNTLGLTREEAEKLTAVARNIYKDGFGESVEEIDQALLQTKQNIKGLNDEDLEEVTRKALILGQTWDADVNEVTRAGNNLMKGFGIESQEAFDLMAHGAQNGLNFSNEMFDNLSEYSTLFGNMGFSAEEYFELLQKGSEAGVYNLDYVNDVMKEFQIRVKDGSKASTDAMEQLSEETNGVWKAFLKGDGTVKDVSNAVLAELSGMDNQVKANEIGVGLYGTKWEDLEADAMYALGGIGEGLEGVDGTMNTMSENLENSFSQRWQSVWRNAKSALLPIGETLLGFTESVMPKIESTVEGISGWVAGLSEKGRIMAVVFAGITAAIGPVLIAVGSFISMVGGMMTALAPLALKIAEAGGLLKYLRLGLAALTGPVGITVAIISALAIGFVTLYKNSESFREVVGNLIAKVKELASQALAMLQPAIAAVVGFFKDQLSTIKKFWDENSSTIVGALENIATVVGIVMKGIFAVIQFIMPAVLALIRAVWGNIKGVISGALDVIMGAVKIFAGLFSGDFAKMWEGVKQVFSGAITFLWNFISLTFFGKVLGGVKLFVGAFRGFFAGMWATLKTMFTGALNGIKSGVSSSWSAIATTTTRVFQGIWSFIKSIFGFIKDVIVGAVTGYFRIISTMWTSIFNITRSIFSGIFNFFKSIFSNIFSYISRIVGNIFSKVSGTWNSLKDTTSRVFGNIFTAVKGKFDDIVNAAKNLPRRIGDGIGSMASKVKDGVNRVVNNLASTLGKGVNGVIGGINWVLGKIGIDKDKNIPKWAVPKYAHGTHGHPGGLAMVGDGIGSNAGRELIQTPSGELALSPSTETLINLPKGSQVLSAKKTKELLGEVPRYANGVGNFLNKAWEGTKKLGGKVKDVAFDVWDYATNPGKLLNKALELLGISKPKGGSLAGNMAGGAYTKVKDNAISFIKRQLDNSGTMAGSGHGFGSKFRLTSRRGFRINPVTGIGQMHQGDDWGAPSGTLIPAQAAGKVIQAGYHSIRGNYVRVKSGIMDRLYQHNSRNLVKVGQNVKRGQAVGTVGSTGRSTGPHLHYEVRKNGVNVNPYGLETGGLVKSEQLVRIGEKNREEVVIPLHPSRRTDAMKLLALAGKRIIGGNGDKGVTRPNQLPSVGGNASEDQSILKALLAATMKQNEILMQLLQKDSNVYVDGGALVGAIGGDINTQLGGSSRSSAYMRGERI